MRETNADCSQWTFNLQPGTTFSNGEVVTAESFIAGMTRAQRAARPPTWRITWPDRRLRGTLRRHCYHARGYQPPTTTR